MNFARARRNRWSRARLRRAVPRSSARRSRALRRVGRVEGGPGPAARDAPRRFRAADQQAVFSDRLPSVIRACGNETALHHAAQMRRDVRAIFIDCEKRRSRAEQLRRDQQQRESRDYERSAAFA